MFKSRFRPSRLLLTGAALALVVAWTSGIQTQVGASTPFKGTAVALPGTIQAEEFDNGGAAVAYSDTTSGNSGGVFRSTDVDLQTSNDTGGGYHVGWMRPTEWLKYTVAVAAAGSYTLEFRLASSLGGARFHVEAKGVDITGPLTFPTTGSTTTWTTIRKTGVNLSAGTQVWTLVVDGANANGGVGNLNYIRVVGAANLPLPAESTPFGGKPITLPNVIQAENFDDGGRNVAYADTTTGNSGGDYRTTDVDIDRALDLGAGYYVGWMKPGEWLQYTVDVAQAGTYTVDIRLASSRAGARFHLESNGSSRTGALTFPATGGTQAWSTISVPGVVLAAGRQVLRLVIDSANAAGGVGNINWIRIVRRNAPVRGPYLQQVTDRSAIVVWTTRVPGSAAVRYSSPGRSAVTAVAVTRVFPAAETGLPYTAYQHEATLTGLAPSARYNYDLLLGGEDTTPGQYSFTAAPATGTGSVRFISFGDSGTGSWAQFQLADRMAADTFDLALHGGDVVYGFRSGVGAATYRTYESWFFEPYAAWLRSRPVFPSIGNHDDEGELSRRYRDVFVLPENGASPMFPDHAERYYSFDYGPVHFVALDTELAFQNVTRRAAQLAWLDADLAATSQPWTVVYFHRSPYSVGEHPPDLAVRNAFVPIFERHRVDLVVSAHDHTYQRSIPWREFEPAGGRVVYVVSGGGGGPLYDVGKAPWTAKAVSANHYLRAAVGGCTLTGQAIGVAGNVLDTFTIDKCSADRTPSAPAHVAAADR
jgi:hypothetical protein